MLQNMYLLRNGDLRGTGDGQFLRIHDIDFNPSETRLYVIDRDGNRIQVFDKNGTFLFKWGSKGPGDGQFTVPYSVDVDAHGNVWVADRENHRIQEFDKDGSSFLNLVRLALNPDNSTIQDKSQLTRM